MKFLIVALMSTIGIGLSTKTEAITLTNLCNRINTVDGIINCIRAADGQVCDERALDVCNRINIVDGIISCVRAVAGKTYEPPMINLCNRINTVDGIVECLDAAGTRPARTSTSTEDVRAITRILRDILEDDKESAEQKLRRLERKLEQN